MNDQIKEKINFSANICFEIWNVLKEYYRKSRNERIENINNKLENKNYDIKDDFAIFTSNVSYSYEKLEELCIFREKEI